MGKNTKKDRDTNVRVLAAAQAARRLADKKKITDLWTIESVKKGKQNGEV